MGINSIEGGRWDNLLRRFFTIKERGVAPSMAPEIVPQFLVEPPDDATLYFLRGTKLATGGAQVANAAGVFGQLTLSNPTGSGTIVTVLAMEGASNVVETIMFRVGFLPGGASVGQIEVLRDTRWARGVAAGLVRTVATIELRNTAVHLGNLMNEKRTIANRVVEFRHPVVLNPGSAAHIENATVNVFLDASFVWIERPAEPGELVA